MDLSQINAPHQLSTQDAIRYVRCLVLGMALLPCTTYGQVTQSQPDTLSISIARAKSDDVDASDIEVIARAGAIQAIPVLELQFARITDLNTKTKIANGLVRLRDKDNAYWNFLVQQATLAVDSDLPDPFHDSHGNATGRQPSPEFITWTQAHHVDLGTAMGSWAYDLPGKVLLLGETGDPRGIPLLQRALQSHNCLIAAFAAKGLALIQDRRSISLIIAAIEKAPPEYRSLIAESLVYFDDVQAQSAVDTYMTKDKAILDRGERARGRGVFGW